MRLITVLLSLAQKVGAIKDYVVEEGTSGSWQYRKWNSGVMEAWLTSRMSVTDDSIQPLMGGMYASVEVNVPSGFTSAPRGTASAYINTGTGFAIVVPRTSSMISVGVLGNQGIAGESATVNIEAINLKGKWK